MRGGLIWTVALVLLAGCGTSIQMHTTVIGEARQAKPDGCQVEVLSDTPQRKFVRIAKLMAHDEGSGFAKPSLQGLLPALKGEACHAGADAIIEVKEDRTWWAEHRAYTVTATAIAYSDN
jgi:hypothetical protein